MIARVIAWSARNLLLVLFGTGFAAAAGIYAVVHLPLDAIPDLSDTQVIVYTEYSGQAPQVIEDQVTYPLTTAMLTLYFVLAVGAHIRAPGQGRQYYSGRVVSGHVRRDDGAGPAPGPVVT